MLVDVDSRVEVSIIDSLLHTASLHMRLHE